MDALYKARLTIRIEELRRELNNATEKDRLKISQEMDELINEYYRVLSKDNVNVA